MVPLIALLLFQQPDTRTYRMYQGGAEVGRETYRVVGRVHDFAVQVPLLNVRYHTRVELDEAGLVTGVELLATNFAADTTRATATLWRAGDSLAYRQVVRGTPREGALHARALQGIIPTQSVAVVAFAAERSAGRDTVLRLLPLGADSAWDVRVAWHGDTAAVSLGPIAAWTLVRGGRAGRVEVPASRVVAELWDGRDSLPPMPGVHRPPPDYSAPAGAPYTAESVRIPVDTFVLAGTLTRPVTATGRIPVVITISGSGQEERDEELWPVVINYRPFRQLAERLARAGMAVLRYDDRTVGGSGGTLGTTADYAADVGRIAAWLRARPDVGRVAVLGHSEGGLIGPMVAAADPAIAAVVVMAGPGKVGRAILRDQGVADAQVAQLVANDPWMRWFADFDPLTVARRVRQPVLIVHGALDRQVSVGQADTLAAAMRAGGNRDVTLRIFPRLNHLFLVTDGDGSPQEYAALRDTAVPAEVLDTIAAWLQRRLR